METPDPDPLQPRIRVAYFRMVTPESVTLWALGEPTQLTVRILDRDRQVLAGAAVVRDSQDSSIATVDANGLVTVVGKRDDEHDRRVRPRRGYASWARTCG